MNLGIIAHNSKKVLIEDFCIAYKNILAKHEVYADMVILFYNTVMMDPKEPDIHAIVMRCDQYNIPVATNIATAELLILGLARGDLDWRLNLK